MRKVFTILFCITCINANGQWNCIPSLVNFDSFDSSWSGTSFPWVVDYHSVLTIDTVNYYHNIWQVGTPEKAIFSSAYSVPRALVTDTAHTYPPNDTSVFLLKIRAFDADAFQAFDSLSFRYYLDIDSASLALVEISSDTGHTWTTIADSGTYLIWNPLYDAFVSASTYGWNTFSAIAPDLEEVYTGADTLLVRFTFISGGTDPHKDGWMIDDIFLGYAHTEAIPTIQNNNLVSTYPNPTQNTICIHSDKPIPAGAQMQVYDILGREVYNTSHLQNDVSMYLSLPPGNYVLRYTEGNSYAIKKLVIE